MPSQKNRDLVKDLKDKLDRAKSIVIFDYSGIAASEQVKLRQEVKDAGGEVYVTKNTIINIAVDKPKLKDSLEGMNALVLSYDDAVSAIKKIYDFKKETEKLEVKKGLMEGKILSTDEILALSKLPSKDELIVTLINCIKGPSYGLVNALSGVTKNLVYVLKAISEKENTQTA